MYEGNILRDGQAPGGSEADFGADGLRVVGWGELVAKLGAARDFRRLMQSESLTAEGSFDCTSAHCLASLGGRQRGINPFALTNRKMAQFMESDVSSDTAIGDRGMK